MRRAREMVIHANLTKALSRFNRPLRAVDSTAAGDCSRLMLADVTAFRAMNRVAPVGWGRQGCVAGEWPYLSDGAAGEAQA